MMAGNARTERDNASMKTVNPNRGPARIRGLLAVIGAALPIGLAGAPAIADQAAVQRGEKVVEEWCRDCHVRDGEELSADMAPPYEMIVAVPGRDRAWFEKFLHEDHFPMTTFRLFENEKADVVEWLLDLQKRGN
jgi:mono/diheme cytochrome c family protein